MLIDKQKSWLSLKKISRKIEKQTLISLFKKNPKRGTQLYAQVGNLGIDYSKSLIDSNVLKEFSKLSVEIELRDRVLNLLSGARSNNTENREVGHFWLRSENLRPKNNSQFVSVAKVQEDFLTFAEQVQNSQVKGFTGKSFTDVVNIGIGGSDLGPAMVYRGLRNFEDNHLRAHFVSNIDENEIKNVLLNLNAESTLFIVTSKTFTTQETLFNAEFAKSWLSGKLGEKAVGDHFVAVSTNEELCEKFGINNSRIFPFWDWVGGRFSLFSSVGLIIAIVFGKKVFIDMQNGAAEVDELLIKKNFIDNPAWIHACINIWNLNFLKLSSLAVIPYASALDRFPAFLQQMWMESNGKSVTKEGKTLRISTSPVIFGEPGTNSQHSFFQMLHQGTQKIPVDFILIGKQDKQKSVGQDALFANALAQASVLAFGKSEKELNKENTEKTILKHKIMPGNKPSIIISMPEINAQNLGQLIAFYEISVLYQGLIMGINSFDQWGVELGKKTANKIFQSIQTKKSSEFDSSTNNQIKKYLS